MRGRWGEGYGGLIIITIDAAAIEGDFRDQ